MKLVNMSTKELQDYLGITDNDNYMYKAKQIADFRLLATITKDFENREICLREDFNNVVGTDEDKVIYEYNDLVAFIPSKINYSKSVYKKISKSLDKAMELVTNKADKENIVQAKRILWSLQLYYKDLDKLCKRLQDNLYKENDCNFEINEQDISSLSFILDLVDGFTNNLDITELI